VLLLGCCAALVFVGLRNGWFESSGGRAGHNKYLKDVEMHKL